MHMSQSPTAPWNNDDRPAAAADAPLRVAIQGYPGAFHEIAARKHFANRSVTVVACDTFDELLARVSAADGVDEGIMAIENSIAGGLQRNYELLQNSGLTVDGEVYLRIEQHLSALPGTTPEQLTEVRSHPMAIAQCRRYFAQYPRLKLVEMADTALAVREVAEGRLVGVGAIASDLAAARYGLEVIAPGIETNKKNFTRFLTITRRQAVPHRPDKVSLSFVAAHEVGSLHRILGELSLQHANLTKIQSMPLVGREWEYRFFCDFILTPAAPHWQTVVDALRPLTQELRVLGAYRAAPKPVA